MSSSKSDQLDEYNEWSSVFRKQSSNLMNAMKQKVWDILKGETLYLYLVDELTMQPIGMEDDVYPIQIGL
jgi:hypothetical protein